MAQTDLNMRFTEQERDLLARALTEISNPAMITVADGDIVWVNAAFCTLSGYTRAELLGQTPAVLHSGKQDPVFYAQLWETIKRGRPWQGELVNR